MSFKQYLAPLFIAGAVFSAGSVFAEESREKGDVHRLSPVDVHGQKEEPGEIKLDAATIKMTPGATNTINDLLRGQSAIQFDSGSRSGLLGGEITPPKISIYGAKHYENNFMINGISNNSTLSPSGFESDPAPGSTPKGDSQGFFIDPSLLESLEVYTENISAQYGDFVGGVLNATLRDAATDAWHGGISYRYTSDGLAIFHYTEADQKLVDQGAVAGSKHQPEFTKGLVNAFLEGPLWNDRLGIMLSYSNNYSIIPKKLLIQDEKTVNDQRTNQNFMLRLNTADNENFYAALTAIYAPYEAVYHASSYKDGGEFSMNGGGTQFILNTHYNFDFAKWSNDFGYSLTEVSRRSENVMYVWNKSAVEDWATLAKNNVDGGMGDYEMNQKTLTWKSVMDFEPVGTTFIHNFLTGVEIKYLDSRKDAEAYTSYSTPTNSPNASGSYEDGVIAGEQFAKNKIEFHAKNEQIDYTAYAFFLEDEINWDRITFRPGVRVTYDTMMEKTDIAPRLFANIDILNDDRFNIYGGYNRYYGTQILNKILNSPSTSTRYTRKDTNNGWTPLKPTSPTSSYELRKLDNPYTDEYTLGASAEVYDFLFKAGVVHRKYEDQLNAKLVQEKEGNKVTWMYNGYDNSGKSEYKGLTVSVERTFDFDAFGRHTMQLSSTWSKTEGSSVNWTDAGYDEDYGGNFDPNFVYLNGTKVDRTTLPASNFNSPWVIAYTHSAYFWEDRIRAYLQLRWEQGGERLVTASPSSITVDGIKYRTYEQRNQEDMFNADLKLSVDAIKHENHVLTFELELLNLFDNKNISDTSTSATSTGTYSMGRQAYLGVKYTF